MAYPRVKITFASGQLGIVAASDDAIVGLIATGVAVTDKLALGTAYLVTSLESLMSTHGITADADDVNAHLYKEVKEFYTEAPIGTNLWFMVVADTVQLSDMLDKDGTYIKPFINASNGAVNILGVSKKDATGYTPVILDAIDSDCYTAITKAQAASVWATDEKYAPFMAVLPATHYSGTASSLADLALRNENRVCVVLGDTVSGSYKSAIGLTLGRIAAIPPQRSLMRVRTGKLLVDSLFVGANKAELANPDIIDGKGFITFRTITGKAGYFFTNDKMAVVQTDDYGLIPRRRVIDKAYRIAYKTIIDELGEEIALSADGTMSPSMAKAIETSVETAIQAGMIGNLGADPANPKDTGVKCSIDYTQDIVALNGFKVKMRIKPFGYGKYIDVELGYSTTLI